MQQLSEKFGYFLMTGLELIAALFTLVIDSIFNISGISYGAISKPAVLALANGAHKAGCWMNTTGEGVITLSPEW